MLPLQSKALIVIDVQESFAHRPYWTTNNVSSFLQHINLLIQNAVENKVPIVRVFHTDGPQEVSNAFSTVSGLVRPLTGLIDFTPALTVEKHKHSALVGTNLGAWLLQHDIQTITLCGIRTEQCCETTARHASDEGWNVEFASQAMLTFDMQSPEGNLITAEQITERTRTVLVDRFVTLV